VNGITTLRGRLTFWITTLLATVGVAGAIGTYVLSGQDPDSFLDDQLRLVALNAGALAVTTGAIEQAGLDPTDIVAINVWNAKGERIRSIPTTVELPQPKSLGFSDVTIAGEAWRTYALLGSSGTVEVAQRASVRQEIALNSALPALAIALLLIPLSWCTVSWLVRRILRPLDTLVDQLESRRPDSSEPLHALGVPDEVAPLVGAINATLARLTKTLALQRQFVSDAAHQLRTPLTALRLQVGNLRRLFEQDGSDLFVEMEQGLKRMSQLTDQLLMLARAEAGAPVGPIGAALKPAINEAIAEIEPLAAAKAISISVATNGNVQVNAAPHELAILFSNLLDNAVRYTPPGGRVDVRVECANDGAVIEISDTGPGLPEHMLESVFGRFVRHAEDDEGTGLGLAIVRAVAERINAEVSLLNRAFGPGLIARVQLIAERRSA
jgi:two-component system OmpR family sensor kinase